MKSLLAPAPLTIRIPGAPRGKGRPRFMRIGNGVRTYTDQETAAYENLVAIAARAELMGEPGFEGAVRLSVVATFPRPKTCKRAQPSVRPDLDNVVKAILDGLNQSGIWRDDAQVCELTATKAYGKPECVVTVEAC